MAKASATEIYNRLHSVGGYHPFSANTFSDWSMEAGDVVTVTRDGKQYQTPVHSTKLSWRGQPQVTMESSGNRKKDPVAVMSSKKYSESARTGASYRSSKSKATGIQENKEAIVLEREQRIDDTNYLSARLTITATEIRSEVVNTAAGLSSKIDQTAGQIRLEVNDVQNGLQSSITQTASQIRSEVNNTTKQLQSSITQQADRISLVVEGTGANAKIKPASIVTAINNGSSTIKLSANHIDIDGIVSKLRSVYVTTMGIHSDIADFDAMIYGTGSNEHSVSWQSASIVHATSYSTQRAFCYGSSSSVSGTVTGYIALGYETTTIHYMGY